VIKTSGRWIGRLLGLLGLRDLGFVGKWVGLATLIGFAGGLAALGFEWLLDVLHEHLLQDTTGIRAEGLGAPAGVEGEAPAGFLGIGARTWLILLVLPLGGLVVGWLTHTFAPEAEGHGTEQLVRTFHELGGRVRRRVIALKALTSAITIGTGGSAGQEGPVAQIGSGLGSALSDSLRLTDRDRRVFLLAGSSAGIGALFTAPLGGALFAPEVLYRKPEFEGEAIIPCIISSIVAYTTFTSISGDSKKIPISGEILETLSVRDPRELLIYLVLALLCTLVGWMYVRTFNGVQKTFAGMTRVPKPVRPALGGLLLALLALGLAPFAGTNGVLLGGYDLMSGSIVGGMGVGVMALLVVGKILATSLSIATGGSGGVFAPSLAIGALLGAVVGQTSAQLFPSLGLVPACYALVGMGGFFSGVAKTPIASIIIVCEMTGSYELLAPLMLVSVVHMLLAQNWTIYETQVPGLVDSPAHAGEFVVDVLERLRVEDLLDTAREPVLVSENATLRRALDIVSEAEGYYFPVVDKDERLVGIFSLSDVRRIFREMEVADVVIVRDFMVDRVVTTRPDETLTKALSRLNEYGLHEIPVLDPEDPSRVIAMLTRNNLGAAYSKRLHALKRAETD
jgi:CIC family chloride channel protein